mmetsp:Transcript_48118/g.127404  ORF Transcript_48118/g.127404 Transcript_48118/m.127404 type:complete len:229 (-) Transcript_48118:651-1337(-)
MVVDVVGHQVRVCHEFGEGAQTHIRVVGPGIVELLHEHQDALFLHRGVTFCLHHLEGLDLCKVSARIFISCSVEYPTSGCAAGNLPLSAVEVPSKGPRRSDVPKLELTLATRERHPLIAFPLAIVRERVNVQAQMLADSLGGIEEDGIGAKLGILNQNPVEDVSSTHRDRQGHQAPHRVTVDGNHSIRVLLPPLFRHSANCLREIHPGKLVEGDFCDVVSPMGVHGLR